jgi:hypothetical protein
MRFAHLLTRRSGSERMLEEFGRRKSKFPTAAVFGTQLSASAGQGRNLNPSRYASTGAYTSPSAYPDFPNRACSPYACPDAPSRPRVPKLHHVERFHVNLPCEIAKRATQRVV